MQPKIKNLSRFDTGIFKDPEEIYPWSFKMNQQQTYMKSSFDAGWMRGKLLYDTFLSLLTHPSSSSMSG